MATRTICDGCGYDLTDRPHAVYGAIVTITAGSPTKPEEIKKHFDLCSDCKDKFKRQFPDKWDRSAVAI